MTLQEIQHKAQSIIHKWRDDDSAPYIEFVDELAHMIVPEPSADLEEAAEKYGDKHANIECAFTEIDEPVYIGDIVEQAYIAGAEWQKAQMLKDAVEGEIQMRYSGCLCAKTIRAINEDKFKFGDKVRIIIVKEEKK